MRFAPCPAASRRPWPQGLFLILVASLGSTPATFAQTLSTLTISPRSVVGGAASTGKVTLSEAAPMGGVTVTLSSDNAAVTLPASVSIPAGAAVAPFPITTTTQTAAAVATVTAACAGVSKTARMRVTASAAPLSLTFSPASVPGGTPSTGTVTLNGIAPAEGTKVSPRSGSPLVVVPATVTVPAGATSVTFTATTTVTAATAAPTITVYTSGGSTAAVLTVVPKP